MEVWATDNVCTRFMTLSADFMVSYCEGGGVVRIADDRVLATEGIGNSTDEILVW